MEITSNNLYIFYNINVKVGHLRFRRIRKVPVYGDKKVKQDYTVQSHEIHQKLPKTDQPKIGFIDLIYMD